VRYMHTPIVSLGKKKAYQLAVIDAEGMTVTDIFKKQWKIGKAVGTGGFGRLYQVSTNQNSPCPSCIQSQELASAG